MLDARTVCRFVALASAASMISCSKQDESVLAVGTSCRHTIQFSKGQTEITAGDKAALKLIKMQADRFNSVMYITTSTTTDTPEQDLDKQWRSFANYMIEIGAQENRVQQIFTADVSYKADIGVSACD